jgi:hypothetical protein
LSFCALVRCNEVGALRLYKREVKNLRDWSEIMPHRVVKTVMALALAGLSALAVAADPPARVGRVALAQGQVSIGTDVGAEMNAAQVNWPVTSGNTITTAPGARTELRIGSTSIRLDGDSSLEVTELDDDSLRLRLHYGSANLRVLNPDVLPGFELVTPQGRVRLQQPARLRVDAERVRDTSTVNVFDGVALVDGGGSQLTVRAGKRAEITDDDVRTLAAVRDGFDDWSSARDRIEDNSASARYVGTEITGYEDLDRYGNWSTDNEYGPLWYPSVSTTWVPYRDGSWTWLDPWGWTWVDNAPWGYAPFHYGRWVQVRNRWAWSPGRRPEHWVWAPALVGWVGGAGWDITFHDRTRRPAFGWYPLSWHDRYVPSYRAPDNHLRWLNEHVRNDPRRGHDRDRDRNYRPPGLTVVPQDRFRQPGRVNVPRAPIATVPPVLAQNLPAGAPSGHAPPPPPNRPQVNPERGHAPAQDRNRDRDGRRGDVRGDERRADDRRGDERGGDQRGDDRRGDDRRRIDSDRVERDGFVRRQGPGAAAPLTDQVITSQQQPAQGVTVNSPPPRQSPQPGMIVSPPPHQSSQPGVIVSPPPRQTAPVTPLTAPPAGVPVQPAREQVQGGPAWKRGERYEQMEELRQNRRSMPAAIAPVQPAQASPAPVPAPVAEARNEPRPERAHREWERPAAAPQRMAPAAPAPAPAPAPVVRQAMPAPQPVAARPAPPPPAPAPAPSQRAENTQRAHTDARGRQQQER